MPEIISTPKSLVQTMNGKRFYVFSGLITVTTAETAMIEIDNIGERDIFIKFELGIANLDGADTYLKVKSNGIIIYQNSIANTGTEYGSGYDEIKLILPANTSLDFTLQRSGSTDGYTVAGHGKYLSM